jgi:hypothetical protein
MPVTYNIDAEKAIIYTKCIGDVMLQEVLEHFQTLEHDPACPEHVDVLLDLSLQTSLPRSDQLREVAHKIGSIRRRVQFGFCAIVACTNALFGMLRMFQVFTEGLFREAEVFRSVADAQAWLDRRRAGGNHEITADRHP